MNRGTKWDLQEWNKPHVYQHTPKAPLRTSFTAPRFSYLGGCRAGCSVATVTLWVNVVSGDLGRGAFDNVDI